MQTPTKLTFRLLLATVIFLAGYFVNRAPAPLVSASSPSLPKATHYQCPMHPRYTSDRSGDCPSCGMRLVAVTGRADDHALSGDIAGVVQIDRAKQQLIGIQTDEICETAALYPFRAPGRVAVDDARQYRVVAGADGWIRELGKNTVGASVKKREVLASYYTPNLIGAVQTFVFALQTNAQAQSGDATIGYQRGGTVLSLQVALDSLRTLGMSQFQIDEIRQSRVAPEVISIYSPVDGFVVARNVSPEQRFEKGAEIFRIADIGRVWVLADVFERDGHFLKPGATAIVRYRGREFPARMADVLPQFDAQSRTLKTRFELHNPGFVLRPDMFVEVEILVKMPPAITIPVEAVVDSGRRKTVFVERRRGYFEPRIIETGWSLGDRVQVTRGLEPGERIAIGSNFLIDSESRMRVAAGSVARQWPRGTE